MKNRSEYPPDDAPRKKFYAELQSSQISQQTGFIGVLVGNF